MMRMFLHFYDWLHLMKVVPEDHNNEKTSNLNTPFSRDCCLLKQTQRNTENLENII